MLFIHIIKKKVKKSVKSKETIRRDDGKEIYIQATDSWLTEKGLDVGSTWSEV